MAELKITARSQDTPPPAGRDPAILRVCKTWVEADDAALMEGTPHFHWAIFSFSDPYADRFPSPPKRTLRAKAFMAGDILKEEDPDANRDHQWRHSQLFLGAEVRPAGETGWVVEFHRLRGHLADKDGIEEFATPADAISRAIGWMRCEQAESLKSAVLRSYREGAAQVRRDIQAGHLIQAEADIRAASASPQYRH